MPPVLIPGKSTPLVSAVLLALCTSLSGCQKAPTVPAHVQGAVVLALEEVVTDAAGLSHSTTAFGPRVKAALERRGLQVFYRAEGGAPVQAVIRGRILLAEEPSAESKVGGPVPFYFVNGAYDLQLTDSSGRLLDRVQGPLDTRRLNEKALTAAHGSYADTVRAIAEDAAPRIADACIRKLIQRGLLNVQRQTSRTEEPTVARDSKARWAAATSDRANR